MPPLDFSLPDPVEKKAGETFERIADPKLLALQQRYERIHSLEVKIDLVLREPADHLSPESWRIFPPDFHVKMIWNSEMMGDLAQLTPQALLRDLYRPVRRDIRYPAQEIENLAPRDPLAEKSPATEVMKRQPWPEVRSSVLMIEESDLQRRFYYTTPWQPAKDDSEPRTIFSEVPLFDSWGQEPDGE